MDGQKEDKGPVSVVPEKNLDNKEVDSSETTVKPENDHKSKKNVIIASAVLLLLLGVGSVFVWRLTHKPAKPAPVTKVIARLQWLHGAEFAGMYVAKDKGYYNDVGLDVDLKEYEDGIDINEEVSSGKADYGVNTPLEIALGRNEGKNNKAIAAIYQISPYAIAARKDANINTPSDFRGKTLGSLGTNNEAKVTYAALLASAGLTNTDATVKGVDFDAVKVLKDHDADTADIYRTDQTFLLDQAKIAYTMIYPELYGLSSYGDMLITSDKKIKDKPAQVQAFVSATLKGWAYAIDHQEETVTTLAKYENEAYKTPGYEAFVLKETAPLVRPTGGQELGSMDYTIWNRIYLSAQAAGLLTAPLEARDLYSSQFVQ